ncbi:anti-sigma factor [Paenibacillus sp. 1011MAR3C5]|uniref:zf-HC2 domain-containing protein n=1 Tax=Paenibacillus sp. 1011MAR3C5 TaxID=1675787 RepID=UPI000E6BB210|nr:zf-HC2 domain-containing protein [Paenibacillus sp. 1011MAR3C5]RJE85245.1 anti-sigma factor [Paenibacillus sp. 1011MAR3C5]
MECKVAIVKIHDYLDGELPREEITKLKTHLKSCSACSERLEQLEKADAAAFAAWESVKPASQLDSAASADLKNRIMSQLPKPKSTERNRFMRILYRYPGLTAAAVFLLVMLGSLFSSWDQDAKMVVSGEDLQHVVINGNTVIVPEGVKVTGNLTVENGRVEVQGSVDGNVTVIDGSMVLASTGHIAGQSRTIDQALDWFWYKVTSAFGGVIPH